ncbi:MAG TPA: type I pullulanase [Ruminiclostridium sp.]|nr:type I pullulanase [Ruminiclostridium sp.]
MRKFSKMLSAILSIAIVLTTVFSQAFIVRADSASTTITIHYYRFDQNYTGWNIWCWPDGGNGQEVDFTGSDAYGQVAKVTFNGNVSRAGIIVRQRVGTNDWANRDIGANRYIENISGSKEVWLLQSDTSIYETAPQKAAKMHTFIDADKKITVGLNYAIKLTGENNDGFTVVDSNNKPVMIASVNDGSTTKSSDGTTDVININTDSNLDVTQNYKVMKSGFTDSYATARDVLDESKYYYSGNDLGVKYNKGLTTFRLWAPTAQKVNVLLFKSANSKTPYRSIPMYKSSNGTWFMIVRGNLNNTYYQFETHLMINGAATTYQVDDPYSYGASANSGKSLIYDCSKTDPSCWNNDKYVTLKNNVDAIIYEMHVRDYTISDTSGVKQSEKGKYLGLTETGTKSPQGESTGLDNLKDLGITHVEIMPSYDYGTGNETESNTSYDWYNWGYDPVLYNTPEGSYASNPNGTARQNEYKQMVEALHKNNIGVIFDAVYNHTYQTGDSVYSIFDKIVPGYYYRVGNDGSYSSGSGCNNDVASENPMVRKYIIDSVKYWVSEYHIDGMRFDLMGLLDKETMLEVYKAAKAINPNFVLYGEGWDMSTLLSGDLKATQANMAGTGIAAFNDGIRDDVKGTVFDDKAKGFALGGTVSSYSKFLNEIVGKSMGPNSIALASPNETINYATCHDNMNLLDKINTSNADASASDKLKMDALTNAIILTAQGVPFFEEGDEFGRSKNFNSNSFNDNSPNVNPINWSLKSSNKSLYNYYKGLIQLRKQHPAFRMTDNTQVANNIEFSQSDDSSFVQYIIKNNANSDSWKNIYVAYNGGSTEKTVSVQGKWIVVVNDKNAGTTPLSVVQGTVTIPAYSALVMYTNSDYTKPVQQAVYATVKVGGAAFNVTAPNGTDMSKVYLVGSFNNWNASGDDRYKLYKQADGTYTIKGKVKCFDIFKFVYGTSWSSVEKDANGKDIPFRIIGRGTRNILIQKWADKSAIATVDDQVYKNLGAG